VALTADERRATIRQQLDADPERNAITELEDLEYYLGQWEEEAGNAEEWAAKDEGFMYASRWADTRRYARALRDAIQQADLMRAVSHALSLGISQGALQVYPWLTHAPKRIRGELGRQVAQGRWQTDPDLKRRLVAEALRLWRSEEVSIYLHETRRPAAAARLAAHRLGMLKADADPKSQRATVQKIVRCMRGADPSLRFR